MRPPHPSFKTPRAALLGMIWAWGVLIFLGLLFTLTGSRPLKEGWETVLFACVMISIIATGFGLLAWLLLGPFVGSGKAKTQVQTSRPDALWDRDLDG